MVNVKKTGARAFKDTKFYFGNDKIKEVREYTYIDSKADQLEKNYDALALKLQEAE